MSDKTKFIIQLQDLFLYLVSWLLCLCCIEQFNRRPLIYAYMQWPLRFYDY